MRSVASGEALGDRELLACLTIMGFFIAVASGPPVSPGSGPCKELIGPLGFAVAAAVVFLGYAEAVLLVSNGDSRKAVTSGVYGAIAVLTAAFAAPFVGDAGAQVWIVLAGPMLAWRCGLSITRGYAASFFALIVFAPFGALLR